MEPTIDIYLQFCEENILIRFPITSKTVGDVKKELFVILKEKFPEYIDDNDEKSFNLCFGDTNRTLSDDEKPLEEYTKYTFLSYKFDE